MDIKGTTIVAVQKDGKCALAGDGQVTLGEATIMKHTARKVRRIYNDSVVVGFAGGVADAFTLCERFEAKLTMYGGSLRRAAVALAQDWRSDKVMRKLEALLICANASDLLIVSGTGEVIEPDDGIAAIGSGGMYALAAARALKENTELPAVEIAEKALQNCLRHLRVHKFQHCHGRGVKMNVLTPKQTVEQLDKYIIGQDEAKRTVAVALRNRYRRSRLPEEMREEIIPKNIIMVGPTGVGKTEIARRLAKLVDAPFVKVEATKFTEVGYVGRDVDSMIRDLVEASIRLVKAKRTEEVRLAADAAAEKRIVDILCGKPAKQTPNPADSFSDGLAKLFGSLTPGGETGVAVKKNEPTEEQTAEHISKRNKIISDLQAGRLEDEMIEIEVAETATGNDTMLAMGIDLNLNEMFGGVLPKKTKARKVTVRDARRILSNEESEKLVDMDAVVRDAIDKAEQDGIVFIDEIDKIAAKGAGSGPDVPERAYKGTSCR